MTDHLLSIDQLHAGYRAGRQARETILACLDRIARVGDPGIFLHLPDKNGLLEQADALGKFDLERKPLWGVPFAVKDNIDVAGMPTTAACPAYSYTPEEDATVVRLLRDAGAIVIGKTNLDQFATGLVGTRTPFPIPKNALDPTLIPGGSSSGSAVAVAQGIVCFALGTDTAGSGRIPAGLNGIVGLKPSLGALSTRGVVPACRTLDCVSIFASRLEDAANVFDVACSFDSGDPYSRPWCDKSCAAIDDIRIGIPRGADRKFFGDTASESAFSENIAALKASGFQMDEITFDPFFAVADLLYDGPWIAERYAAIEQFLQSNETDLHPVTRAIITKAHNYSAIDTFNGLYALQSLKRKAFSAMEEVDIICVPTAPTWYTIKENLAEPIVTNSNLGTYTNFVNLLGLCGLVVPRGKQVDGRPSSITFLARDGCDLLLGRFADLLLADTETRKPARPVRKTMGPRHSGEMIDIAVVGAHLSGLPLNHELTDRGAVFRRSVQTTNDYRLFALSGTIPPKPGLLRVGRGAGCSIATEIWSLKPDAFGDFVATIPTPLCLGTLQLEDGTSVQGFLAESEGVKKARDVSAYGSWRAFINSQSSTSHPLAT